MAHLKTTWKTALITGAGSGIGLCLAKQLAAQGVNLILINRSFKDEVKRDITALSSQVQFLLVDVRDRKTLKQAIDKGIKAFGSPDIAVNCAGVSRANTFEELSADDFDMVININLVGSRNVAACALPHMKSGSRFVFVSSLAGLSQVYGYAAYNASKYGVIGLAGALRLEYKPKGIAISVACPPEFPSPLVEQESKTAPDITYTMKAFAGQVTAEQVAKDILNLEYSKKWMIVTGGRAKFTAFLAQHFPMLMRFSGDSMVKKGLK